MRRAVVAMAALCCLLLPAGTARAQSPQGGTDDQAVHPCQAEPEDKAANDDNKIGDARPGEDGNLQTTEKLDRCNGVLLPPPTGDREIEAAPPDTGTTPVIPPGGVPQQP